MVLPADHHVHSEWSYDAVAGSMEQSCRRAIELGLPALAFTEHADFVDWTIEGVEPDELGVLGRYLDPDSVLRAPSLDVDGYVEAIAACRAQFPDLRIMTGLELGEPHRCIDETAHLLRAGTFDRVNGSLHLLPVDGRHLDPQPV